MVGDLQLIYCLVAIGCSLVSGDASVLFANGFGKGTLSRGFPASQSPNEHFCLSLLEVMYLVLPLPEGAGSMRVLDGKRDRNQVLKLDLLCLLDKRLGLSQLEHNWLLCCCCVVVLTAYGCAMLGRILQSHTRLSTTLRRFPALSSS